MDPRRRIYKKMRAGLKWHLVWLFVILYIALLANPCLSIDKKEGDREVTLTWIKPTKNEDGSILDDLAGYYIYRSEGGSDSFERLNEEPVRGICYTDTNLINGIKYFYAVTAVDYCGNESKKSTVIDGIPNILPPSGFKVKAGDGEVQLFWDPYERSDLRGYNVYRRSSFEEKFMKLNEIPIQETLFIDTQVANGLAYFYKICCVGIEGIEGSHSQKEGATPMAIIPDEPSSVHARYMLESNEAAYVLLTWEETEEADMVGYRVYRRLLNEREFTLLTQDPIQETQYMDTSIQPEKGYLYSVVAVTESGMESQYPKEAKCFTSALFISSFTMDTGGKAKKAGDEICFCLRGEPGLSASYKIQELTSVLPMEETSGGIYNACLDITREMSIEGGKVTGFLEDPKGNRTYRDADETLVIDNQPPDIIKNAKAEWDAGIVKITWEPPTGEFSHFEILRLEGGSLSIPGVDGSQGLPIETVSGDKSSCYDSDIKPDRNYYYSICTLDRAGNRSDPFNLPSVYIPFQSGIPFIKIIHENTAGLPQKTGDRIEVELIGEEGCRASFLIPGIIEEAIPLNETGFGQYSGYYIVRPDDKSEKAFIKVCLEDDLDHINCQNIAAGLIINSTLEDNNPPVIEKINHNAFEIAGFSGKLVPGNILEVNLDGEAHCKAFFIITSSNENPGIGDHEFDKHILQENQEDPGHYFGTYTVEWEDESMEMAYIWACMSDRAGNRTWKPSQEPLALDTRPRIKVDPEDYILRADEESQSQTSITVEVTDANEDPVPGHIMAFTITTTDEYTGVVGGGDLCKQIINDTGIDYDLKTDSQGRVVTEYISGFAAKTAIILAKDLTTGHAGSGFILNYIKAQIAIELKPPSPSARLGPPPPYKLVLKADPDRLTADGVSSSWITAQLVDRNDQPVRKSGVLISFFPEYHIDGIQNGSFSSRKVYTDSLGQASTRFTAGTIMGTVIITGSCSEAESGFIKISLMSDAPAKINIYAYDEDGDGILVADGKDHADIKVWVADINENAVQEAMVEFSVHPFGMGTLSEITKATDRNGWAQSDYTAPYLPGQSSTVATIIAKITSKVPTEEELARANGTIFIPILYPEMEEEDEVKILEWLFRKGEDIKQGAPVARIETRKGEYFLRAPVSGELVKITIHRGERAVLGQPVGQILTEEDFFEVE